MRNLLDYIKEDVFDLDKSLFEQGYKLSNLKGEIFDICNNCLYLSCDKQKGEHFDITSQDCIDELVTICRIKKVDNIVFMSKQIHTLYITGGPLDFNNLNIYYCGKVAIGNTKETTKIKNLKLYPYYSEKPFFRKSGEVTNSEIKTYSLHPEISLLGDPNSTYFNNTHIICEKFTTHGLMRSGNSFNLDCKLLQIDLDREKNTKEFWRILNIEFGIGNITKVLSLLNIDPKKINCKDINLLYDDNKFLHVSPKRK